MRWASSVGVAPWLWAVAFGVGCASDGSRAEQDLQFLVGFFLILFGIPLAVIWIKERELPERRYRRFTAEQQRLMAVHGPPSFTVRVVTDADKQRLVATTDHVRLPEVVFEWDGGDKAEFGLDDGTGRVRRAGAWVSTFPVHDDGRVSFAPQAFKQRLEQAHSDWEQVAWTRSAVRLD